MENNSILCYTVFVISCILLIKILIDLRNNDLRKLSFTFTYVSLIMYFFSFFLYISKLITYEEVYFLSTLITYFIASLTMCKTLLDKADKFDEEVSNMKEEFYNNLYYKIKLYKKYKGKEELILYYKQLNVNLYFGLPIVSEKSIVSDINRQVILFEAKYSNILTSTKLCNKDTQITEINKLLKKV